MLVGKSAPIVKCSVVCLSGFLVIKHLTEQSTGKQVADYLCDTVTPTNLCIALNTSLLWQESARVLRTDSR